MSALNFNKDNLGNLEYSLGREMLETNKIGGYMNTTIVGCNTRKYHGLMVCPANGDEEHSYVFLSSLDETIIQHDQAFNLALHRYPDTYDPRGHKYLVDFSYTPVPTMTYRVGSIVLRKEMLFVGSRHQLLIRYTLIETNSSDPKMRIRPFMAFRDKHALSKANLYADGHSSAVKGGMKCRLYGDFPWLYLQTDSATAEFVAAPEWYYSFEYLEELKRGYDFREDLLTTGYFEAELSKEKPLILSCSLDKSANPDTLSELFDNELSARSDKCDFLSCLRHAASQFIVHDKKKSEVIAGFPWFGHWGRDTFISLPGITLSLNDIDTCRSVINTMTSEMRDGLFPNMGTAYNSVDAPLWFFWTLQQLEQYIGSEEIWRAYGKKMKSILEAYRNGIGDVIEVHPNGLVWASHPQHAMTWMDAVVDGKPVTGRDGYQVEINALWYNAVCYTLKLAREFGDKKFTALWEDMPETTKASFLDGFWHAEEGYLADYIDTNGVRNTFIRPNQIIACSLEYKMLSDEQQLSIADTVRQHLLTPKGLRTLSPQNPLYEGCYEGDQQTRDRAYHQGTVWVWLLEHYVKAMFDLQGSDFIATAEKIIDGFSEDINSYGIGSIAEIYDGDPPHAQRGATSQAWSVGALLRIQEMIDNHKKL